MDNYTFFIIKDNLGTILYLLSFKIYLFLQNSILSFTYSFIWHYGKFFSEFFSKRSNV